MRSSDVRMELEWMFSLALDGSIPNSLAVIPSLAGIGPELRDAAAEVGLTVYVTSSVDEIIRTPARLIAINTGALESTGSYLPRVLEIAAAIRDCTDSAAAVFLIDPPIGSRPSDYGSSSSRAYAARISLPLNTGTLVELMKRLLGQSRI